MKSFTSSALLFFTACLILLDGVSSQCIDDFNTIFQAESNADISMPRMYVLCPNTIFKPVVPLILRSNAMVKCGEDGSSANDCTIDGAFVEQFGILVSPRVVGFPEYGAENVVIQGVTLDFFLHSPPLQIVAVYAAIEYGDVTFLDCRFTNNNGDPMFVLQERKIEGRQLDEGLMPKMVFPGQVKDHSARGRGRGRGLVDLEERQLQPGVTFTFDSCLFKDNYPVDDPTAGVAMIVFDTAFTSGAVNANFFNNEFIDNDYQVEIDSVDARYLIDFYSDGELRMERNCFVFSPVTSKDESSIVSVQPGSTVTSINNHVDSAQEELPCPYVIETDSAGAALQCRNIVFDSTECLSDVTVSPATGAPATPTPTTDPATSAPVTPVPATSAPVTAAPVAAAPTTPAPATQAPVSVAPVTPVPITPAPVTAAPVTPVPATQAPITAAPVTPDPATMAPVTAAPVTPDPATMAPVTAAPVTMAPVSAAPATPIPATQAPVSTAPATPVPATQAPVSTVPSDSGAMATSCMWTLAIAILLNVFM